MEHNTGWKSSLYIKGVAGFFLEFTGSTFLLVPNVINTNTGKVEIGILRSIT